MSNYIDRSDYTQKIRTYKLDQIIDEDESILDSAELDAIDEVNDYLFEHYDTDIIFEKTGDQRDRTVVRWCRHIVMYNIYQRIPDELVPERVIKDYQDTINTLKSVASNKLSVALPRKQNEELQNITRFRGGSETPRSH